MVVGRALNWIHASRRNKWLFTIGTLGVSAYIGLKIADATSRRADEEIQQDPELQKFYKGTADEVLMQATKQMIQDYAEGRGDIHWQLAMRGRVYMPPPEHTKTYGRDMELLSHLQNLKAEQDRTKANS